VLKLARFPAQNISHTIKAESRVGVYQVSFDAMQTKVMDPRLLFRMLPVAAS